MIDVSDMKEIFGFDHIDKSALKDSTMILDSCCKIARKLELKAADFDQEGAKLENGKVILPPGARDLYKAMADMGLFSLTASEKYDGSEMPYPLHFACMETIARGCPSAAVSACIHATEVDMLQTYGSEPIKEKFIPLLASGRKLGGFAFTEANSGSDLGSAKMKAVLDPSGKYYTLNGTKQFITSGGFASIFVFLASTKPEDGPKGLSAFVIDTDEAEGFAVTKIEKKMGIKASPTAEIVLTNTKVPVENILGKVGEGFRYALAALDGGRIGIAAQATGIADSAFKEALKYAGERMQFGKAINKFAPVREKLALMGTKVHAARLAYLEAASMKVRKQEFTTEAAIAKVFATESAEWVCREGIQIHGGYGYIKDYSAERHYRDSRITTIYEGTSEIQRIVISRDLLNPKGSQLIGRMKARAEAIQARQKNPELVSEIRKSIEKLEAAAKIIVTHPDKSARQFLAQAIVDMAIPVYISLLMLNYTIISGGKMEKETRLFISDTSRSVDRFQAEIQGNRHELLQVFHY